jgi:hypothetical protein
MDESEAQATPPQSLREFERALRGMGFTRLQATHIARHGFAPGTAAPDEATAEPPAPAPADDTSTRALAAALERLRASLKD